jgi:hypothetical protein
VSLCSVYCVRCVYLSVFLREAKTIARGDSTYAQNKNQLRILDCAAPGLVRLSAPGGAQD